MSAVSAVWPGLASSWLEGGRVESASPRLAAWVRAWPGFGDELAGREGILGCALDEDLQQVLAQGAGVAAFG